LKLSSLQIINVMKTKFLIFALALLMIFSAFQTTEQEVSAQIIENKDLRSIDVTAFKPGEVLEYRLHYGVINAGVARLEVNKFDKKIDGREVFHIVGTGQSKGAFDWFFKVRDRYETVFDAEGAFPWAFLRDVNEGGYKIKQNYKFIQKQNKVINEKGVEFSTPEGIQDMLSCFYFARTIDFTNAKVGEIFTIWSFVDDEIWPLKIKFAGRETVKVEGTKFKAMKFHPVIQTGRLFKNETDVSVWISDDINKIPLLAEGKVMVGAVKMELTSYKGLAGPISKVD
jgi:hypothetical protein